jgi:hypothetical protein
VSIGPQGDPERLSTDRLLPGEGEASGRVYSPGERYGHGFLSEAAAHRPGALPVSASRQGPAGSSAGRPVPRFFPRRRRVDWPGRSCSSGRTDQASPAPSSRSWSAGAESAVRQSAVHRQGSPGPLSKMPLQKSTTVTGSPAEPGLRRPGNRTVGAPKKSGVSSFFFPRGGRPAGRGGARR